MKRRGSNWFKKQSRQNTYSNASKLPTIMRTGPEPTAESPRQENAEGNKFFQVGVDEIGGDEVI